MFRREVYLILYFISCHYYADDFQVYAPGHINSDMDDVNKVNNDLNKIQIYCKDHGLRINANKTVAMCFSSDAQKRLIKDNFTLTIANNKIKKKKDEVKQ